MTRSLENFDIVGTNKRGGLRRPELRLPVALQCDPHGADRLAHL